MRTLPRFSYLQDSWPLLSKALGLMAVSSLVRGLSVLVPVMLAAVEGAGSAMDQYMAFLTVIGVVCAMSAGPFATLVSREVAGHTAALKKSHKRLEGGSSGYGKPARRCRRWAKKISLITTLGYLALSGLVAHMLSAHNGAPKTLWVLLLIGTPCVYASARIAVEQALLQARGRPYLALGCSAIFSGTCLLGAVAPWMVGPGFGSIYICAAAVSLGATLELLVTRKLVTKKQESHVQAASQDYSSYRALVGPDAPSPLDLTPAMRADLEKAQLLRNQASVSLNTSLENEPSDLAPRGLALVQPDASGLKTASRRALVPWKDFLVLTGAAAGGLFSGFFDQSLMSRMGNGVQAAFGLASRFPSFLALSIFAAGSIMAAMLIANKSAHSARRFHIRVLELFALMLVLSTGVSCLLWWQAYPLTHLVYERGAFTSADTLRVAQAIPVTVLAYFMYPASAVLMRCAAVESGARTLLISSGVYLTLKVSIGMLAYEPFGLPAIAASSLCASIAQCSILWHALLRGQKTARA